MLACQGARVAVPHLYPFFYPHHGYRGQLAWLEDTAVNGGQQAYCDLLAAGREGVVELPRYYSIRLPSGQMVHLGPRLTTPTAAGLKKRPSLLITSTDHFLIITHKDHEKDQKKDDEWELEIPDLEEKEEEVKQKEEGDEDPNDDDKEKEKEEEMEKPDPLKEEASDEDKEQYRRFREDDARERRKLFVSLDKSDVSEEDLRRHFEQFGEVLDIFLVPPFNNFAVVTFFSPVLAQSMVGRNHTLQRPGGSVPLRLRGGSGRMRGVRGVPPTQQRNLVCPYR